MQKSLENAVAKGWIDKAKYLTYTDWNDNLSSEASQPDFDTEWMNELND